MSNYIVDSADLTSVANAIRTKGGTSAQLAFPADFVQAIEDIETGGGDYTAGDFGDHTKPVGDVVCEVAYMGKQNSNLGGTYFAFRTGINSLYMPNFNNTGNLGGQFRNCGMKYGVFPKFSKLYNSAFLECTNLVGFDWRGGSWGGSSYDQFKSCSKLKYFVIRSSTMTSLASINIFAATPFASGKSGGTLYVPADLVSTYEAATNWSTILGYANNQIKSIESTATDPDAPVDLTTHYIDGTPIPTE